MTYVRALYIGWLAPATPRALNIKAVYVVSHSWYGQIIVPAYNYLVRIVISYQICDYISKANNNISWITMWDLSNIGWFFGTWTSVSG